MVAELLQVDSPTCIRRRHGRYGSEYRLGIRHGFGGRIARVGSIRPLLDVWVQIRTPVCGSGNLSHLPHLRYLRVFSWECAAATAVTDR
jgi:hypothetical protein